MLTATERLQRLRSLTFNRTAIVIIIVATLVGTALGYRRARQQPFIFKVTSSLLVQVGRESAAGASPEVIMAGGPAATITERPGSESLNTELQLLKSPELMREVFESIQEEEVAPPKPNSNNGGGGGSIMGVLFNGINSIKRALQLEYEHDPKVAKFEAFKARFTFSAVPKSTILEVKCQSPYPEVGKLHLERFLSKYKDFHMRAFSKSENNELFESQLKAVKERLLAADAESAAFRLEHNIADVPSAITRLRMLRETTVTQLRQLDASVAGTQARLDRTIADLESGLYPVFSPMSQVESRNPLYDYLERLRADTDLRVSDLSEKFVEGSQWVLDARASLSRATQLLEGQEVTRTGNRSEGRDPVRTSLTQNRLQSETQLAQSAAERKVYLASLETIEAEIRKLEGLRVEFNELMMNATELRLDRTQIHKSVRLGRANVFLDDGRITNLKVITPPTIPARPITRFGFSPRVLTVISGAAVGFFLSLAFFLVRGAIRDSGAQRRQLAEQAQAKAESDEDDLPAEVAPNTPTNKKNRRKSDAS